jgi:CDP-6-deoxy-D-xylo-4-hexulose-3-dehydrase
VNDDQVANSIEYIVENAIDNKHAKKPFIPGESAVPVTGKVFDKSEIIAAVNASLDFWLTSGPETEKFERDFAKYVICAIRLWLILARPQT